MASTGPERQSQAAQGRFAHGDAERWQAWPRVVARRKVTIYIDLSAVQWADPICLMQLLLALKFAYVNGCKIRVQFGKVAVPRAHAVFLAFFGSQGFATAIAEVADLFIGSEKVA